MRPKRKPPLAPLDIVVYVGVAMYTQIIARYGLHTSFWWACALGLLAALAAAGIAMWKGE